MQVTGIFGSSMEVMVSVCGENPTVGDMIHCGDAYVTAVSVDEHGGPVDVPFELHPLEPCDVKRCAQAAERCGCQPLHPAHSCAGAGRVLRGAFWAVSGALQRC